MSEKITRPADAGKTHRFHKRERRTRPFSKVLRLTLDRRQRRLLAKLGRAA
jgi:hypothetical protein